MFNGLGNLGNLASMVGKLKDMPERMQQLREGLRHESVEGTSSCGHVHVVMNGLGEVQSVQIDPALLTGDDSSSMAQTTASAVQEATNAAGLAAKERLSAAISQLASDLDLNLPGMDGLLSSLTGGA
ncbi:MAG: YbaB/EbfC family nucleoid-associated protein [Planctomycetota bacterium]